MNDGAVKMGRNADAFDFLLGEWELAMLTLPEGSTVGRRANLSVHRILDGAALLDEIRHIDESGQVNFRGATFRTYLVDRDRWYVLWMMANIEGCTELEAQLVDGEVRTTGSGKDPWGELEERGRYHDISGNGFSFTLERSNTREGRGSDRSCRFEPRDADPPGDAGCLGDPMEGSKRKSHCVSSALMLNVGPTTSRWGGSR